MKNKQKEWHHATKHFMFTIRIQEFTIKHERKTILVVLGRGAAPTVVYSPGRLESGGSCRLLKLRQIGSAGSAYERVPSMVGSLGSSCRYKKFLSCLGQNCSRPTYKYFFPHRNLFHFISPHHPASWAVGTIDFDAQMSGIKFRRAMQF
jgi:hypothetical protein